MKFKEKNLLEKIVTLCLWAIIIPIAFAVLFVVGIIILAILAALFVIGLALIPFAIVWYLLK